MHDDDIICGTCGKRNDANRVTCWSCKEILEEEASSSGGGTLKTMYYVGLFFALLAVLALCLPLIVSARGLLGK